MNNQDIEHQLGKLRAGKIKPVLLEDTLNEPILEIADANPRIIGDTIGQLTADPAEHPHIKVQQELLIKFRKAVQERRSKETEASHKFDAEVRKAEIKYQNAIEQGSKMLRHVGSEVEEAEHDLQMLQMQLSQPSHLQIEDSSGQLITVPMIEKSINELQVDRIQLEKVLDEYAMFWLKRFRRLLLILISMGLAFWILIRLGRLTLNGINGSLIYLRELIISNIQNEYVQQGVWIGFLALLIGSIGFLTWTKLRPIYIEKFGTEEMRTQLKQNFSKRRTEVVRALFDTDENPMTSHFWGRMWLMMMFATRRKFHSKS